MATIADFRLPLAEFPLGVAIEAEPSVRIDLERIVPTEEGVLPFFWVRGCADFEAFERRLLEREAVLSLELISETPEEHLYRARWNSDVEGFVRGITRIGATILNGRATTDGWRFELRFGEREQIRSFQRYCHRHEVPVELNRIYTASTTPLDGGYQLTDDQRETIRLAYDRGYFEEPQGVTQTDLAAEFGVSQRAVSRRLRRGLSRLVGSTVAADLESSSE
ncbi:helix-turn-helix domain-containing protein [Natrononativus amylolyticus]|uniref:helix-turn-helix domain-containing protein n=1 Tax=Natrononativus amylolyticus TaxID=2963434 RepID=UPI0020CC3D71|nr:helix-turn-helix domain-containing protein [Natrononativus amylolyticus]